LIGFGFAIAQSYQFLETDHVERTGKMLDTLHTPFIFGISFMVLGILGIMTGVIQYNRILERIKSDRFIYIEPWALPKIMAILLVIIGVFGIFAIIF
jgi:putative membrane protein